MSLIFAKRVFSENRILRNCLISTRNGRIHAVAEDENDTENTGDLIRYDCLAPGFIDIHINGGESHHFTQNPSKEALWDLVSASRASGTPFVLPTCITSSWENILEAIWTVRSFRKEFPETGVLGMHLEGPFLHPAKRGAHPASFLLKPDDALISELVREGEGVVKMITIAPELFKPSQIRRLIESGIVVSIGHSNADFSQAMAAFGEGIQLCTHLFNAMSGFGHREPGLVGAVFSAESVYAPVIADGIHCSYDAIRIAHRLKNDKLFLISDALFQNRKRKEFHWGEFDAYLKEDRYINSEGNLAGGAIRLSDAVVNAVSRLDIALEEAVAMVTDRPAAALKMPDVLGKIAPGYPAVFTTFNESLTEFNSISY